MSDDFAHSVGVSYNFRCSFRNSVMIVFSKIIYCNFLMLVFYYLIIQHVSKTCQGLMRYAPKRKIFKENSSAKSIPYCLFMLNLRQIFWFPFQFLKTEINNHYISIHFQKARRFSNLRKTFLKLQYLIGKNEKLLKNCPIKFWNFPLFLNL